MTTLNKTKLGQHTRKVGSGITPKGGSNVYLASGVPFIRSQNVLTNKLDLSDVVFISEAQHRKMSNSVVKSGDVLLNITGASIGRSCVVPEKIEEANVNQHVCIIRTKEDELDNSYLCHFLNSEYGQKIISSFQAGGNRQGLNYEQIRSFPLGLPDLEEQKKIAKILSTWDEAIESVEDLIAKKRTLKRVIHHNIFTEKSDNWEKQSLSEVVNILDNKRVPLNSEQRAGMRGSIPYYGANGKVDCVNNHIFDEDLILMAEDGGYFDEYELRPIAYKISGKSWVNNHAHVLKVKDGYDYNFVFYSLEHKNILRFLNGGTRAKLNRGELEKIHIGLPTTYEEQDKIGKLFSIIDYEIELLSKKSDFFRKQKSGLMQRLLT